MARKRAVWETKETCKMYEFQKNNYEEVRIRMHGRVFSTFHGQNAHRDARRMWETIKELNA